MYKECLNNTVIEIKIKIAKYIIAKFLNSMGRTLIPLKWYGKNFDTSQIRHYLMGLNSMGRTLIHLK